MTRAILVPLGGSPLAERALAYAEILADATGARVHLLRTVERDRRTRGPSPSAADEVCRKAAGE